MLTPFVSAYGSGVEGFPFISPYVFLCSVEVYCLGSVLLPSRRLTQILAKALFFTQR